MKFEWQNRVGESGAHHLSIIAAAATTALSNGCANVTRSIECLALVFLLLTSSWAGADPVELQLILAIDASGSIDDNEFELQRSRTAAALRDPTVQNVVVASQVIAVIAFQWSSERKQTVAVPWTRLQSKESVVAFAEKVERMPRKIPDGGTAIHAALAFGHRLFENSPFTGGRRVIDISGNGEADNVPATIEMRDKLVTRDIVINALAIVELRA